jgi:prepilin-type N-terminal cleavage/methylation domain-containing protein/prepilin-type processing-associated H-X9-DG protein
MWHLCGVSGHDSKARFSTRGGFTLVELLAVIAILAILATLTATVSGSFVLRAKESRCMSNMRHVGIALQSYAADNGGKYPETSHTVSLDHAWIAALEGYLGEYDETRICPADPRAKERLAAGGTSYILNSFLFVPETDAFGEPIGPALNRPASIPDPTRTLLAFVCSDKFGPGSGNDHTHSNLWSSWSAVTADVAVSRFGSAGAGRSNYLYADGRVESIAADVLKRKTSSGTNIALPPGL